MGKSVEGDMTSILIKKLKPETTVAKLKDLFGQFGEIRDVYIPLDYHTKEHRGFGFVEFTSRKDATAALDEMDRSEVDGSRIEITLAQRGRSSPDAMRYRKNTGKGDRYGDDSGHYRGRYRSRSRDRYSYRGYKRSLTPNRHHSRRDRSRDKGSYRSPSYSEHSRRPRSPPSRYGRDSGYRRSNRSGRDYRDRRSNRSPSPKNDDHYRKRRDRSPDHYKKSYHGSSSRCLSNGRGRRRSYDSGDDKNIHSDKEYDKKDIDDKRDSRSRSNTLNSTHRKHSSQERNDRSSRRHSSDFEANKSDRGNYSPNRADNSERDNNSCRNEDSDREQSCDRYYSNSDGEHSSKETSKPINSTFSASDSINSNNESKQPQSTMCNSENKMDDNTDQDVRNSEINARDDVMYDEYN